MATEGEPRRTRGYFDLLCVSGYVRMNTLDYHSFPFVINEIVLKYYQKRLRWNCDKYGGNVTFTDDDTTVNFGDKKDGLVMANCVVDSNKSDVFEWTIIVHEYSNRSFIGFIDANSIEIQKWEHCLHCKRYGNSSIGIRLGADNIVFCGSKAISALSITTKKCNPGDHFKFVWRSENNKIQLFHNEQTLGFIFENVHSFVPAVSSHWKPAMYTIQ